MDLGTLMAGRTPSVSYEGFTTADDFVLAVNLAATPATHPDDYYVAQKGVSEHSGSLDAQTDDKTYIREGKSSLKTATQRSFTLNGDRVMGDEFQDALLAHAMKFGTGQTVIKDYVYFNVLTGKGEKGQVSIAVEDDPGGAAGESASWSATLSAVGTPEEYTYVAET